MTSYKIFKIEEEKKINNIFSQNWFENVKAGSGDIETVNQKLNLIRTQVRSPKIVRKAELASNGFTLNYQFNMELPGNNKIWVPQEIYMLQASKHLFISRGAGDMRFAVQKYLDNTIRIFTKDFSPKRLITVYNKLKRNGKLSGYDIFLHRIILRRTYLNGNFIKELNLSTAYVDEMSNFNELINNSEKIYVITFKIKWNLVDENGKKFKDLTARIDTTGNLLIYGVHSNKLIDRFLELLIKSL